MIPSDNAMAHEEWAAKPSGGQEDSKRVWSGCASPLIEQQHGDDMHVQLCMIFSEQNQASELPSAHRADQQNCKRTPRRRRQCATSHGDSWNKRTTFGLWPKPPRANSDATGLYARQNTKGSAPSKGRTRGFTIPSAQNGAMTVRRTEHKKVQLPAGQNTRVHNPISQPFKTCTPGRTQ